MSAATALTLAEAVDVVAREARRAGSDRFDIEADESDRLGLDVFAGQVTKTDVSSLRGLSIRLFRGRRPGCARTERLTVDALRRTVTEASAQATLADEADLDLPEPAALPAVDLQVDDPTLDFVSLAQMKALALHVETAAFEVDPRVENLPYLRVSRNRRSSIVCNSNGVLYQSRQGSTTAGVGAVARYGQIRKMGIDTRGGRAFDYDAASMARRAVERAVELLDATPLASGVYPVVFSHRVSPQLFGLFASPFFAEAVHEGRSRLQGQIGRAIAVPEIAIVCDPLTPRAAGSYLFDSEGVPARTVHVVRDGVLQTYLSTLASARATGVPPTGTGSRDESGAITTRLANYQVGKGVRRLDDLLAAYSRCLYVVQLEGTAACSAVSGEISIGAQGFMYERGRRTRPVDRVTINTNFFDLLHRIRGLSDTYSDAFGNVFVPDVLVDGVHVSG